jgi:transcriptional regulator with XRE-family HTH domain
MVHAELPIDRYDTLRSLRIKFGISQEKAAEKIGVSHTTLRSWEKDSTKIGFDNIQKIEMVYGVDHRFIFFGKESTFSELMRKKKETA